MNASCLKSLRSVVALSCLFAQLIRADTTVSVGSTRGVPGSTASVPIQFASDTSVVAVQFDLIYEAANLSAGNATGGNALVAHSVKSSEPSPGIRRVVVYSFGNEPIQNGMLVNIPLSISPGAPERVVGLTLANVVLSSPQATRIDPITLSAGGVTISTVGEPPTISCPPDIVAVNDPGQCSAIVTYTITYRVTDPSGNGAIATRTVRVVDTKPPVLTLAGDNSLVVNCNASFTIPSGIGRSPAT